jgi:CTP-dependent riboflavin kinase
MTAANDAWNLSSLSGWFENQVSQIHHVQQNLGSGLSFVSIPGISDGQQQHSGLSNFAGTMNIYDSRQSLR